MTLERKKVLVVAKAAPEASTKYGECVCTAGITSEGEFIRLYPVPLKLWKDNKGFSKFDWIEVDCEKAKEYLNRKESYHINPSSIRIVDSSLAYHKGKKTNWSGRQEVIETMVSPSIEDLRSRFEKDRTSLGIVRAKELLDFYKTKELNDEEREIHQQYQMTFDAENPNAPLRKEWILHQIPHVFKYKFTCHGGECQQHNMTCEDWELFEALRRWPDTYKTEEKTWEMIVDKYLVRMKDANLHFLMGTHSKYPTWMIIGLYYPPKGI